MNRQLFLSMCFCKEIQTFPVLFFQDQILTNLWVIFTQTNIIYAIIVQHCEWQVLPLLHQLHDCGSQSSHHVYMLLIILLILSQDDCFNKSIHESVWELLLPHLLGL